MNTNRLIDVAEGLFRAGSVLAQLDRERSVSRSPGRNFTFDLGPDEPLDVARFRLESSDRLANSGLLLGWAYVSLVWLPMTDLAAFKRLTSLRRFAHFWHRRLWKTVTRWRVGGEQDLASLLDHLGDALRQGRVDIVGEGGNITWRFTDLDDADNSNVCMELDNDLLIDLTQELFFGFRAMGRKEQIKTLAA